MDSFRLIKNVKKRNLISKKLLSKEEVKKNIEKIRLVKFIYDNFVSYVLYS